MVATAVVMEISCLRKKSSCGFSADPTLGVEVFWVGRPGGEARLHVIPDPGGQGTCAEGAGMWGGGASRSQAVAGDWTDGDLSSDKLLTLGSPQCCELSRVPARLTTFLADLASQCPPPGSAVC